jgi:hypothetical protein
MQMATRSSERHWLATDANRMCSSAVNAEGTHDQRVHRQDDSTMKSVRRQQTLRHPPRTVTTLDDTQKWPL